MRLLEKQFIFAQNYSKLISWAFANGLEITLGEVWRPPEMQKIYFETGRAKVKTTEFHGNRIAADINIFIEKRYRTDKIVFRRLGEFWESLHPDNVWGGRFGIKKENYDKEIGWDPGHIQMGK